ncbi:MAG: hypothetical protein FWE29_01810 [Defluviitaleaceae bacterium]|nr:hypothetical protein [Defluviitaleaceae bacterium]
MKVKFTATEIEIMKTALNQWGINTQIGQTNQLPVRRYSITHLEKVGI